MPRSRAVDAQPAGPAPSGSPAHGSPAGDGDAAVEGIVLGDNLEVLRRLPDGCIDLVYIDPPFGTGRRRRAQRILLGQGERTRRGFRQQEHRFAVVDGPVFDDGYRRDDHCAFLEPRLRQIHRVLRTTGSLYVHLDWRSAHRVRLLLDAIFGPERFLNEIVWAYDYGGRARDRWPAKHDTILWYARGDRWTFDPEAVDRIPYLAPALVGPTKAARGKLPTDVWWMTVVPTSGSERTGYPTQKPLRLLERIVASSSRPGDVVADFFAGSGTTGVAAARLGRRWLVVDENPEAVAIMRRRLAPHGGGVAPENLVP